MSEKKFGTTVNCMDGRTQVPVSDWMIKEFDLDYVDTVTEAGPDKIISEANADEIESIKSRVLISVEAHGSEVITIVGHYDCAGNPVSEEQHQQDIKKAMKEVASWDLPVKIIGLWVGSDWQVEVVDQIEK